MANYKLRTTIDYAKIYNRPGGTNIAVVPKAGALLAADALTPDEKYYHVYEGAPKNGYISANRVTLDTPTIQGLIDVANEGDVVKAPAGIYQISQPIQCRYNVSLDLTGCTLQAAADVDMIHAAHRADITGGFLDCSQVTFTHTALVLDGESRFDMTFPTFFQNIKMLGNWQSGGETGTGILMQADSGFVQGVIFSNISMSYFRNGIRAGATPGAWTNGNHFSNLVFMICRRAVVLEQLASGNTFSNIQYQPDAACERALYCEDSSNLFSNFMVWDWPTDRPAIEFTSTAMLNMISTDLYQPQYFLDAGWGNKIITPFS